MSQRVLIAYTTKAREGFDKLMPSFDATPYKEIALAQYQANMEQDWRRRWAPGMPFTATLSEVALSLPSKKKVVGFKYRPPGEEGRPPIHTAVSSWLEAQLGYSELTRATFVGFQLRRFFQVLSADVLSLQEVATSLAYQWYNSQLVSLLDLGEILTPSPYAGRFNERELYTRLGITLPEAWREPCHDVAADLALVGDLAIRMGLVKAGG